MVERYIYFFGLIPQKSRSAVIESTSGTFCNEVVASSLFLNPHTGASGAAVPHQKHVFPQNTLLLNKMIYHCLRMKTLNITNLIL